MLVWIDSVEADVYGFDQGRARDQLHACRRHHAEPKDKTQLENFGSTNVDIEIS